MTMELNTIKPAVGAKHAPKRVGRGIGSGLGKTCGRGHKGQKSRAGGFHKVGFEGGQMPLQRRLPKRGFKSLTRFDTVELRTQDLALVPGDEIDVLGLKQLRLVPHDAKAVKLILNGPVGKSVVLHGVAATAGARAALEAAGGKLA